MGRFILWPSRLIPRQFIIHIAGILLRMCFILKCQR